MSYKSRARNPFSPVAEKDEEPVNVHKAVACDAGVSDGTVHHYMQIAKHGSPELLESVKNGKLKINTARRLLTPEIQKQLRHASKLYCLIEEDLPLVTDPHLIQDIKSRLGDLQQHLHTLMEANRLGSDV